MSYSTFTKRITLLFLSFLLFQNAHSQENYLAGYIVRLGGDTLRGFVDYRNWVDMPTKLTTSRRFKLTTFCRSKLTTSYVFLQERTFPCFD
jgi:hypothetical protein